jgi:predicted DsbA family dithiol-disulfide isomerase
VALAWISARIIRSFCLVCTVLYAVSLVLFLMLLVVGRKRVGALLLDGPRELLRLCPRAPWLVGLVLFFGAAFSQLVFAPGLFRIRSEQPASGGAWSGLPTAGQTIGPPDAPLKIEEFTDFQCPHCGNAHTVMMEVLRRFPGKIHLVHRDFPLDLACNPMVKHPMHPHACEAARYARCAAQQGKYWPYEELLFENREQLGEGNLKALARRVGLDLDRLERCVRDPRTEQAVLDDINEGLRRKLGGTPTLFVNGEMMVGMRPLPYWEARIKRLSSR